MLGPGSTVYAGIKAGIQGFAEALRRELGPKGIRVVAGRAVARPGRTCSTGHVGAEEQREMIARREMLRAEDIAVGVHYLLTQPRRTVVQQLTIAPRDAGGRVSYPFDQLVFTPDDVDLSRSPLAGQIDAETYVLGAFNPGMTRLPNGNLLLMVRVAEALQQPIRDGHIHAIRWDGRRLCARRLAARAWSTPPIRASS